MRPLFVLSGLLTFVASSVALANNPQVAVLREQVRVLRAEEKNLVHLIRQQYNSIINTTKINERQLVQLRKELGQQERQYLALTANKTQKENIRRHYDYLRRVLGGEGRVDAATIRKLREEETVHVRLIQTVYQAKIREMEQVIQVASKIPTATPGRRR
jgi:hypothetical protein